MSFNISDTEYGQAGYGKSGANMTMSTLIDRVMASTEEAPAPYLRRKSISKLFPSLQQDIHPLPEYLLPNWLGEKYLVKHVRQVLNTAADVYMYIGGTGGIFPVLHYDGAGTHAFLIQIYGRKQYILYSPDQEQLLYPAPQKKNLSLVNVEMPDLQLFPLFTKAKPTLLVLEPGELLFIPSHWWHTAKMLTPSITVSANVLNQSNWHELVNFVAAGRGNPLVSLAARTYLGAAGARRSWRDRTWRERTGTGVVR